jgi:hypothetical protein
VRQGGGRRDASRGGAPHQGEGLADAPPPSSGTRSYSASTRRKPPRRRPSGSLRSPLDLLLKLAELEREGGSRGRGRRERLPQIFSPDRDLGFHSGMCATGRGFQKEGTPTSPHGCLRPNDPARIRSQMSWTRQEAEEVPKKFTDRTVRVKSGRQIYCAWSNVRSRWICPSQMAWMAGSSWNIYRKNSDL